MKHLEELEHKVLRLIEKHQELQAKHADATKEIESLRAQVQQFEASLLKETSSSQALVQEKATIVTSIEALLTSLNALENNH
ncbi:hypothetical protein FJ365_01835 [Candidatus Dependentiae bacterium]|nr:hypothetical protein [Candidatus Dependentiae bacterium]